MTTIKNRLVRSLGAFFVLLVLPFSGFSQPALPPDPFLNMYSFEDTNWVSIFGDAPIGFTNLVSVPIWHGNALLLDTTNSAQAFLAYNIIETNGYTNIDFPIGDIRCVFICDWASADTNQSGAGLGDVGYLLAAGDFSSNCPDGLWAIYFDPGGTNIYFGGVSNSTSTVFVSAPISWPSNSIHLIGINYTATNSQLFLDGQLAATGSPVSIVPATNTWTNGFNIGSDPTGYEQARGIFCSLILGNTNFVNEYTDSDFTNAWPNLSNNFAAWQGSGGDGADFSGSSGSLLSGGGSSDCVTNANMYNVYMANMSYGVVSGHSHTFTFTIEGGAPGVAYDVFRTTNLIKPITNAAWTWLGAGTNCGVYSVTNQTNAHAVFLLGTPLLASDGSGLTVAYENLISTNVYGDTYGTPTLWYLWNGLSPQTPGIATNDADGDGLLNYQEYLYGSNPQVSEGFAIWMSEPELTSGIP